jgi:hypothetical protein
MTALARKRIKLIQKLDKQILAAEAEANDEVFMEDIRRWVRNEETGKNDPVMFERPIKKWWWTNQHGALMISLKDGNKIIPLDETHSSIEVGGIESLAGALETVRAAVIAGELDTQLEKLIAERKPFGKNSKKQPAMKTGYSRLFNILCQVRFIYSIFHPTYFRNI